MNHEISMAMPTKVEITPQQSITGLVLNVEAAINQRILRQPKAMGNVDALIGLARAVGLSDAPKLRERGYAYLATAKKLLPHIENAWSTNIEADLEERADRIDYIKYDIETSSNDAHKKPYPFAEVDRHAIYEDLLHIGGMDYLLDFDDEIEVGRSLLKNTVTEVLESVADAAVGERVMFLERYKLIAKLAYQGTGDLTLVSKVLNEIPQDGYGLVTMTEILEYLTTNPQYRQNHNPIKVAA